MTTFEEDLAAQHASQSAEFKLTGGNAFPIPGERGPDGIGIVEGSYGLSKREFFAAQLLAAIVSGICANGARDDRDKENPRAFNRLTFNAAATDAVTLADALIATLSPGANHEQG